MKNAYGIEIYETLEEIADPRHSCLVIWDVQNGLVNRIFNKDAFTAKLAKLVSGLRGKMPVVYTLITPPPKEFSSPWNLYSMMKRFGTQDIEKVPAFMAPGSPEREIPAAVAPRSGDLVLEKATANIFLGTNFEMMMRHRGVRSILFTGIATEMGVETSARDASCRGFYPVIVKDCVSSADPEAHERSLAGMSRQFILADSETLLAAA